MTMEKPTDDARRYMLDELTEALGWGQIAKPESPAAVWAAALGAVRELREQTITMRFALQGLGDQAHKHLKECSAPKPW